MKIFFLFALICAIEGSINQPIRSEFFSGYRNDRIHWHLQNPATTATDYSERYRDVEFWENGLILRGIYRDIAFLVRGSYSAFGRGRLSEHYTDLSFTSDQPKFQSMTTGWAADASGFLSYAVNLTDGRLYKWIFLPLLGYSGHFEKLNRTSPKDPYVGNSSELFSSFPQPLRQNWYGVFTGAAFQIEPGGRLAFHVGYTYHWLHTRFISQWREEISSNGDLNTTTTYEIHLNRGGNRGQTGWAQVDYYLSKYWKCGFGAQIHYFSTSFLQVNVKENGIPVSQIFKLRWTPIDGWFQFSREF